MFDKHNTYVQNFPEEVEKNFLQNVCEKNADRIYAEKTKSMIKQKPQ